MKCINQAQELNEIVLFFDPMHQIHNTKNDYCWQFKGKSNTKTIGSNSGRQRLNIIGALNPIDLTTTIILTKANCDTNLMITYLKHLRDKYKSNQKITLILDNASYNRAYATQDCAKELNIELLFLPPYAPNLNLIERLWKFFKKKVMKNKYYETYKIFEENVENFFVNFKNYEEELRTLLTLNFGIIKAS